MNPFRISESLKPRDNEMIALVLFYLCGEFAAQQCRPKTPGIQGASMLVKLTLILMAWYFFFEPPPPLYLTLSNSPTPPGRDAIGSYTQDPKLPLEVSCFAQLASWTNCMAQAPRLAWSMYPLHSCLGLAGSSL